MKFMDQIIKEHKKDDYSEPMVEEEEVFEEETDVVETKEEVKTEYKRENNFASNSRIVIDKDLVQRVLDYDKFPNELQFSDEEKRVLRMYFIVGLTNQAIGRNLNIPSERASSVIYTKYMGNSKKEGPAVKHLRKAIAYLEKGENYNEPKRGRGRPRKEQNNNFIQPKKENVELIKYENTTLRHQLNEKIDLVNHFAHEASVKDKKIVEMEEEIQKLRKQIEDLTAKNLKYEENNVTLLNFFNKFKVQINKN